MHHRILLAGTNSGCGKTTMTLALLAALKARGLTVSACKCGPDYIDPMFHRKVLSLPSRNLDPFFCSEEQLCANLAASRGLTVIEGVMGYYDGIGKEGRASTWHVAKATRTPVLLVVNGKGMQTSAGALLTGFLRFREENNIRGVLFNNISGAAYPSLQQIAADAGLTACGYLPARPRFAIGSRHLGLITADEIRDLEETLWALGAAAEETLDIPGILELAASAPPLPAVPAVQKSNTAEPVTVAVAQDAAFCFLYQENLELLEALGCRLRFFSPIADDALPQDAAGLYLPGGYPELYLDKLSQNRSMLRSIRTAVASGMPTIAECGGFLYLHRTVDGVPMAGVIPAEAERRDKLQRFGYITLTAKQDNLLTPAGGSIRAHEFHYYHSSDYGSGFSAEKAANASQYPCVHTTESLYAGFPHLYFPAAPSFAAAFVQKARSFMGGAPC